MSVSLASRREFLRRTAVLSGSAISMGSLKKIIMPSPAKRSSVAPCDITSSPIAAW